MLEHQPEQTQNLSHTRTPIELMQKKQHKKKNQDIQFNLQC